MSAAEFVRATTRVALTISKFLQYNVRMPTRGNLITESLGRIVMWMLGWSIQGKFPDRDKLVVIVAPHTSNWDFLIGMAAMLSIRLSASWLGKHTIFFWPLSGLLRWLGGIPIDRSLQKGTVDQIVDLFHSRKQLVLGLSPEGTRKKTEKWKTGFYQIALQAGVPILPISFDYSRKVVGIGPLLTPGGDLEKDLHAIGTYYSNIKAKHPEQFSLPVI